MTAKILIFRFNHIWSIIPLIYVQDSLSALAKPLGTICDFENQTFYNKIFATKFTIIKGHMEIVLIHKVGGR